ncbi:hypothetical protein Q5H93_06025 [Hymenobacter sp. ASUV-10]|uniref:Uncharacterized protein n=1 Tax=Hymenobacter aranciens TaxID=3063996 RepID=A0ABT9B9F3_9BACT|nr:hypothetical protein [Hymenobacter sp. ASUV-10]MDO7874283.1 hypothetical protein [Hymenobacter sp. ASUV-10]
MLLVSTTQLVIASEALSLLMQVSIIVPMVVSWRRWSQLSPLMRLLSSYVYLSALSVVAARWAEWTHHSNLLYLMAFNAGKIILFTAVYFQVLQLRWLRWLFVGLATVGLLAGVYVGLRQEMGLMMTYFRTLQCGLLAALALAYLEQLSREPPRERLRSNPMFLLSVGQLIYSAGTVVFFSLDFTRASVAQNKIYFGVVAISGLIFNTLLTMAFLRARPDGPETQRPVTGS